MTTLLERDFQATIVEVANLYGWRHSFTRPCRGKGGLWTTPNTVPMPDLQLWHPGRGGFLIRELKVPRGKDGRILEGQWKDGQREVIAELQAAGVDCAVWTPAQLDDGSIVAELNTRRGR